LYAKEYNKKYPTEEGKTEYRGGNEYPISRPARRDPAKREISN